MGKKEREKGKRGELKLKDFLNSLGLNTHRGYVFCGQSDLVGIPGIHVECKNVERLNVRAAMEQAIEESQKRLDGWPTVFWKANRKPWLTVMRTEDWVMLYLLARGKNNDGKQENVQSQTDQ